MKKLCISAVVLLGMLPLTALAHRLDEYLEATILSVDAGHVNGTMRLVPGVAVSAAVISNIDSNGDGVFSAAEQQAYAEHVVNDLLLKVDDQTLAIRLVSETFPSIEQIKQGLGEIRLNFTAELPGGRPPRTLVFENHHDKDIGVYLVNCLVPSDQNIRIVQQTRNQNQSFYQLDFAQGSGSMQAASSRSFSGFSGAFRLGVRHIAEGTDHLLFLITLLLPAPLLAYAGRWSGRTTLRQSLLKILRIVTAFTLGHSLTLLLSAFGLLQLPSRPVEVLIAVSILVSAVHALRPIFPGREASIAAFFGLIHGLAFASALSDLGFGQWYRLVSILGFNLGIEAMQLIVVCATLPSLLILSRTPVYAAFRASGATIATVAALGWILERAFKIPNAVGPMVERAAHHAPLIAASLLIFSVLCWSLQAGRNLMTIATNNEPDGRRGTSLPAHPDRVASTAPTEVPPG